MHACPWKCQQNQFFPVSRRFIAFLEFLDTNKKILASLASTTPPNNVSSIFSENCVPENNLSGALQIGTEIPMHVKSAMSEFYISSGSLFKQLCISICTYLRKILSQIGSLESVLFSSQMSKSMTSSWIHIFKTILKFVIQKC